MEQYMGGFEGRKGVQKCIYNLKDERKIEKKQPLGYSILFSLYPCPLHPV